MKRALPFICAALLASAPIADACTLQLTIAPRPDGNSQRMSWTPLSGVSQYDVFERASDHEFRQIAQVDATSEPAFIARPTSTKHQNYGYLILARTGNDEVSCTGTAQFEMDGDDKLAALTHKGVVPLVGSVRGAFGSDFRTSLTLLFYPDASGRIVFRPSNSLASDSDPSLNYSFGHGTSRQDLYWDDVVAAMGATGTGTLEIIPNARPSDGFLVLPEANVRVYNVTSTGTFGSRVPVVRPSDWIRNREDAASVAIPPARGNFRRNAGIRTITRLLYRVNVSLANGEGHSSELRELPAGYTFFGSLEALVGEPVAPETAVGIQFVSGNAIGFYTETENTTNDATVVIKNPQDVQNVTWSF